MPRRVLVKRLLAVLVGVALFQLFGGRLHGLIDNPIYDAVLLARGRAAPPSPEVVIVEVDDASVAELGRFPWSRARFAQLLDRLRSAAPRAILLDFLFSAPADAAGDRAFEAALKRTPNAVLSVVGHGLLHADGRVRGEGATRGLDRVLLYRVTEVLRPLRPFAEAAGRLGQVSVVDDPDGVIRRLPLYLLQDGLPFPSLSVAGLASGGVSVVPGDFPMRSDGTIWINWGVVPPNSIPRVSFHDVLAADRARLEELVRGRWVCVMANQTAGTDYIHTPLSWMTPGGQVHVYSLLTLLKRAPVRRLEGWWAYALAVLLTSLLVLASLGDRPGRWLAAAGGFVLGPIVLSWALFRLGGPFVEAGLASLASAGTLIGLAYLKWAESSHREGFLRRSFSRFFGRGVGARILHGARGAAAAERVELTVLFTDLTGFTSFADQADAGQVEEVLRLFNDAAISAVEEQDGTVDKLIGDAVMAYWNYPAPHEDHAARALRSALSLRRRMSDVNAELRRRGLPGFAIRTGVATGPATVGEFGNARFASYTAIGRTVNLAQRLQTLAAPDEILAGPSTQEQALGRVDCLFSERGQVTLKGFHAPVVPYRVGVSADSA